VARLDRAAREQNERVARQAAALEEAQVTAQEIRQTSLMAADKANAVLGAAHRADEVGRSGEDALAQSLNEPEQILSHVDAISRTMGELGESTSRIAGITALVKDLADQSNMLALNAAFTAVQDLSASMTDLVQLIEQGAQSVRELGGVSARIGGIVSQFRI
jgi:methyl-accepting chemotaxis protein